MVDKIGNIIGENYRYLAKGFMSVLKESKFYEEGILTPEEFLKAGNYLTQKCPTWKWCKNKQNITPVEYLPKDQQFLQTTVSCIKRVKYIQKDEYKENLKENDWIETKFDDKKYKNNEIQEIDIENLQNEKIINNNQFEDFNNHFDDKNNKILESDINKCLVIEIEDNNILKSRTYDVIITYDFYYRVPRLWLIGYSEFGYPLSNDEIKEDIMLEYIDKTVTFEKHPNIGLNSLSIHPCKHSLLIKNMIKNFENLGKKLEVEKSIVLLLKFLSSIVPTIKYDFTLDVDFK